MNPYADPGQSQPELRAGCERVHPARLLFYYFSLSDARVCVYVCEDGMHYLPLKMQTCLHLRFLRCCLCLCRI